MSTLKKLGPLSTKQIADTLNIPVRTVRHCIKVLKNNNVIRETLDFSDLRNRRYTVY
ncbi:MAG: winged helix-turn-helix transcriptional regulator [Candidatus Diapherotrites archaeon]|nr:winged helix-turn-helix transcriptional regulator [Candidatus Diapherotrites archaeon]